MSDVQIKITKDGNKGKAYATKDGDTSLAEMTFSITGAGMWIVDHTEVDESLRGQGVGRKMLDLIVEDARKEGIKILPLCPYAKSVFDKDESIGDVLR